MNSHVTTGQVHGMNPQKHYQQQNRRDGSTELHVEVAVNPTFHHPMSVIEQNAVRFLHRQQEYKVGPLIIPHHPSCSIEDHDGTQELDNVLRLNCSSISIEHDGGQQSIFPSCQVAQIHVHAFVLHTEESEMEDVGGDDDGNEGACETLLLPHLSLVGLWDSIILHEDSIKTNLLSYATTALLFGDAGVSSKIISWNRIILLHGEPGTGKTSLCKALAQKLSIRLSKTFRHAQLLEVHSHSLFSKWFSESGKLVAKLFGHIQQVAEDSNTLVCVLIDEVESLAAARSTSIKNGEPSDAIRTVNAMLTAIDRLQRLSNVLIFTTTNMSSHNNDSNGGTPILDLAFIDRADVKQYIGLPPLEARYEILRSCTCELIKCGIILVPRNDKAEDQHDQQESSSTATLLTIQNININNSSDYTYFLPSFNELSVFMHDTEKGQSSSDDGTGNYTISVTTTNVGTSHNNHQSALKLLRCAQLAEKLSGRSLRKLPFQAHAQFIRSTTVSLLDFLDALHQGILKEHSSRQQMMMIK